MKTIELKRVAHSTEGTFGVLVFKDKPFAVTVELPYKDNIQNISCIPYGIYNCLRLDSPNHGNTFKVIDVRGRSNIVFHVANTVDDLEGCIGVGTSFGILHDKPAVLMSKDGIRSFLYLLKDDKAFELRITNE